MSYDIHSPPPRPLPPHMLAWLGPLFYPFQSRNSQGANASFLTIRILTLFSTSAFSFLHTFIPSHIFQSCTALLFVPVCSAMSMEAVGANRSDVRKRTGYGCSAEEHPTLKSKRCKTTIIYSGTRHLVLLPSPAVCYF